jgi:hypothetical protein
VSRGPIDGCGVISFIGEFNAIDSGNAIGAFVNEQVGLRSGIKPIYRPTLFIGGSPFCMALNEFTKLSLAGRLAAGGVVVEFTPVYKYTSLSA